MVETGVRFSLPAPFEHRSCMGSFVEINDTLQITVAQGFPEGLHLEQHYKKSFTATDFAGQTFAFKDKPGVRIYHAPPVRTFLVENKNGEWIYWGLIHVLSTTHDYVHKTTSGTFVIIKIFTPEEMVSAQALIDFGRSR